MATYADIRLSKSLSWILRHQAKKQGLSMREDGFVPCAEVSACLAKSGTPGITLKRLQIATARCPKRRFELSPCGAFIRATQGHSIHGVDDAQLLVEITDATSVPVAVHGTRRVCWESLKETGLLCGSRNHIHIATSEASAAGFAGGDADAVLVYIDVVRAMRDGLRFFQASNGVVLTRGVDDAGCLPATYFASAVRRNRDGSETRLLN